MFHSYLFDGDPEDLDGLPNAKSFVILSQGGFVRCVEKDVSLSPTVRIHVERRVIYGDRYSMVHYLLMR
ncbi:MAG: hypothetical protein KME22_11415 [Hassallia sp. WJT32-NPBG1]|nr:hypothetical protein [Hassallia sp. WJT32-NPBG1]